MKIIVAFCALIIQLTFVSQFSSSQQRSKKETLTTEINGTQNQWRAGTYLGLTVGKSTRSDVLRELGQPKRLDTPVDQPPEAPDPEIWYVYENIGDFAGVLTVVIDKRSDVVLGIDLSPDDLSKDDAVRHFGPDYIVTRYNFDDCLGTEESAPLYESANGPLLEIEYRHRGIAVSVNDKGQVKTISYVSKPIGTRQSRCNSSNTSKRQENKIN